MPLTLLGQVSTLSGLLSLSLNLPSDPRSMQLPSCIYSTGLQYHCLVLLSAAYRTECKPVIHMHACMQVGRYHDFLLHSVAVSSALKIKKLAGLFVYVCMHVCVGMQRGQKTPTGQRAPLPSCGSQELNSDHQVRHGAIFHAEPSC